MTAALHGERLAALETTVAHMAATLLEVRKTQIEIRDTQLSDRARLFGGWSVLQFAYPPAAAVAIWIAAHMGFAPLPR